MLNYAYQHPKTLLKIAMSKNQKIVWRPSFCQPDWIRGWILDIVTLFCTSRRHGRRLGKTALLA